MMVKKKSKGGRPKKYGDKLVKRYSFGTYEELWEWCERRAKKRGMTVSAFITQTLENRRLRFEARANVTKRDRS